MEKNKFFSRKNGIRLVVLWEIIGESIKTKLFDKMEKKKFFFFVMIIVRMFFSILFCFHKEKFKCFRFQVYCSIEKHKNAYTHDEFFFNWKKFNISGKQNINNYFKNFFQN